MDDLIRRQAAIKAIEILSDIRAEYNIFSDDEEEATRYHALSWAIQALNEQQRTERKKGKWIDVNGDGSLYECDQCHDLSCCVGNYCMECGARMEEQG